MKLRVDLEREDIAVKTNLNRASVVVALVVAALASAPIVCCAQDKGNAQKKRERYRGMLGKDSKKVRKADGKTYVFAGPPHTKPTDPAAEWYDFTGSPIPAEELQFGIGKDAIRAIDDPVYVAPDDPRLLKLPASHYRRSERPKTNDEIMVTGYVGGGEARAYPIALLDHHELVNDVIGGKPVTVGW